MHSMQDAFADATGRNHGLNFDMKLDEMFMNRYVGK